MSQYTTEHCRYMQSNAALSAFIRVAILSTGKVAAAEAGQLGVGTTDSPATAADQMIPVRLNNATGTRKCVANGAISRGALVYCAAAGKVGSSGTVAYGVALEASTADNDIIEVETFGGDLGCVRSLRTRVATAAVNTGTTLLPAMANRRYRLVDASMISIGGNASGATAVRINGVQSGSTVQLVSNAVAALTANTRVLAGVTASSSILAGGLSFVANDANTAITLDVSGSSLATSTHIDVLLTYVVES